MEKWKVRLDTTAFTRDQFPERDIAEFAVAGRSNVGKSSLVNRLLGAKLAHVGATPGKTRSINFYRVETPLGPFMLVDLPGYGYASRSKKERRQWSSLIEAYITSREAPDLILHLADFRHGLTANDRELQDWISGMGLSMLVVFTKGDKISKGARKGALYKYIQSGLKSVDVPIVTSAEKGDGIAELKGFLEGFLSTLSGPGEN
ncbi:MAG: ribosome biogenesis GTP-binding protein YihA/YsxC [Aminivibrio sp.]|jgi:GTP-binding protein|nr:YihA family ribosome biogenesis GTP-binding protein [Synergistaceae bacterium]